MTDIPEDILNAAEAARNAALNGFDFDGVWDALVETYGFASTSPVAKEHINFVLEELEKLKELSSAPIPMDAEDADLEAIAAIERTIIRGNA